MAITLKQLAMGSLAASSNATTSTVASQKIQVATSIRLVNTHATASVVLNVSAGPSGSEVLIAPKDLTLAAGQYYSDDVEITLKTSDHLKIASGSAGGPTHYVISGFEKDQA